MFYMLIRFFNLHRIAANAKHAVNAATCDKSTAFMCGQPVIQQGVSIDCSHLAASHGIGFRQKFMKESASFWVHSTRWGAFFDEMQINASTVSDNSMSGYVAEWR